MSEITMSDMAEDPYTDWADVVSYQAREDALNGYGDHALKMLIAKRETWKDPFDRQRIEAVIRELAIEPWEHCPNCGEVQEIVAFRSGGGFAGGRIYWTELACGHVTDWDESDDMRAAR